MAAAIHGDAFRMETGDQELELPIPALSSVLLMIDSGFNVWS